MGVTRKEGLSLADTIEGVPRGRVPRRAVAKPVVAILTAAAGPSPYGCEVVAAAPTAFAASRTAPATAPATLSLKTLGMM